MSLIGKNENRIDPVIFHRILKLLATPIRESKAYRLGIIDEKGKQKKIPTSTEEKDSFTLLNRLVFRLQGLIIRNNPSGTMDAELRKIATSTYLIKECIENNIEPLNLELIFRAALESIEDSDLKEFQDFVVNVPIPYSVYSEDVAANNSMATGGIERPETKLMGSKEIKKQIKKKKLENKTRTILEEHNSIDPNKINPLHELRDKDKYTNLVKSMKKHGWVGDKIVAFDIGQGLQAVNGTHRIHAARQAGIDIPIHKVSDEIGNHVDDYGRDVHDMMNMDDGDKAKYLHKFGDKEAGRIMDREEDNNYK